MRRFLTCLKSADSTRSTDDEKFGWRKDMSGLKINTRLKVIREELGYTQEQFAEILDMSLSGYKKIEGGDVNLGLDKMYIMNKRLGVSADYILFAGETKLPSVWGQVCGLPEFEKWQMFLRLYAYLSKKLNDESSITEMMRSVDNVVKEFIDEDNYGD